ncbi:MAG: stage II sporulation protein D [Clostridia bacterium]|nr:stage II sporulation protein D [Clostridia bacterium]
MKKMLLFSLIIILIPTIVVNIFIKDEEIKFEYHENMVIRVKRSNGNIEKIPFEDYIVGILAGEMPVSFHSEALKAQAVAARTYAMKKMALNINNDYDVVDTVSNQVYLDIGYLKDAWQDNYVNNINILKTAVLETYGEYLEYKGEVIEAFFFSTSTGKTENSEDIFGTYLPYLRSVDSTWDNISPVYEEKNYYTLKEFYDALDLQFSTVLNISIKKTTSTGRIKEIVINNKKFTGSDIATSLDLRSSYFEIIQDNNTVIINTKGYGHGVGMSQYGAEAMSDIGYTYEQILKYYYQGVEIKKI